MTRSSTVSSAEQTPLLHDRLRVNQKHNHSMDSYGAPRGSGPGLARRTLGISLLLTVVVLWTTSSFLASTIFADNTYSKPFFMTYFNTAFFTIPLFTVFLRRLWGLWRSNKLSQINSWRSLLKHLDSNSSKVEEHDGRESDDEVENQRRSRSPESSKLGLRATAKISLEFCLLWFSANYFSYACLQYTTVGSTTILTSTSAVWTLIFGAMLGVERISYRKSLGVIASLVGIILISRVDVSGSNDSSPSDDNSSIPYKTPAEVALGDAMAAFSAVLYGVYTTVMKKQVGDESRVNMQVFFGLVGVFNLLLIWPGFLLLHFTGVETFALPDTKRVWYIIIINALTSLVSDIAWAYAMLLTTPLVVTVGISMTIPLSLVGQIFLQGRYSSALYWFGATIVFLSFLVVNHESQVLDDQPGLEHSSPRGQYGTVPRDEAVGGDDDINR